MDAFSIALNMQKQKQKATPQAPSRKRVAVYARYSSVKQNDLSIEGQLREAVEYCVRHDYDIVAQYVDQAKSGRSRESRAQFNQMMEDASRGIFDIVLVYKFNRFFRNLNQQSICLEELKRHGVDLLSIRDPIPDGRGGIYMRAIYGADAEAYSLGLSEDTKRGMLDAHREGKNTGMVPFGYTVENRRRVIEPFNASGVKLAFELAADGHTLSEICAILKSKGYRSRYGNPISVSGLGQIFRRVDYMGIVVYKGDITEHPDLRIVEPELFQQVQEILASKTKAPQRGRAGTHFALTEKLYCGHCGAPVFGDSGTSRTGETRYYYTCRNRKKHKTCNKRSIPKDVLEQTVFRTTMQALTDENIAKLSMEAEQLSQKLISNSDKIRALRVSLNEVNTEIRNIGRAIASGIITATTKDMLIAAEQRRAELERELSRQENISRTGVTADEVAAWLLLFRNRAATDEELKDMMLRQLVQEVYVFDDPDGDKEKDYIIVYLSLRKRISVIANLFDHSKLWGAKIDVSEPLVLVSPFIFRLVGCIHR